MKKVLLLLLLFPTAIFAQKTTNQLYQEALEAYEEQDYELYLERLRSADEQRPNHPTIVYKLAGAWSLNGRRTRSVQKLNQLMLMDATIDFQSDSDFDNIRKHKQYDDLVALQKWLTIREIHDEVFLQIDAAELHPESFVVLNDGTVLLGSVREKKIVKVQPDGTYVDFVETPYAVLGMKYDSLTNTLWAATAAMPEMLAFEPADNGKSVVLQIDVENELILQGLEYDEGSIIGDIYPDSEKRLWLSNSMSPYLSRDDTDTTNYYGAFTRKQFDLTNTHFNLQGLALTDDEQYLYFSDYISGLFRVNIATDNIEQVFAPSTSLLKGIDGLYYYRNSLIAIHNGTKPYKVVQYFLDESGTNILVERVINRGGESLGEPTLGQVKDGYFYYLANSPWPAYDEHKNLNVDNWGLIEIRRIKLD